MRLYRLARRVMRLALSVFFRRIEVVGRDHVPDGEAVLFCGNHPNSLLDPALITAHCRRIVHFAAKDTLFQSAWLKGPLSAFGAVPIRRRVDHGGQPLDNQAAFAALTEVLGRGGAIGIFPEGISHDGSQLSRLKTGAARIAFAFAEGYPGRPVHLIPTGLNYTSRDRFRSSALVQFGTPVTLNAEMLAEHRADEQGAVRRLTETLDHALRGLTVNADDWETIRVLDGVRRLYQPPGLSLHERIELARRFNAYYPEVRDRAEVRSIYVAVRGYLDRLSGSGLSDRDVRRGLSRVAALGRLVAHLLLMLVWLPLALAGSMIHVPVGALMGWIGGRMAPRKDVVATSKFVIGFLVVALAYALVAGIAYRLSGWRGALAMAILLPLSGYATLRVLERTVALRRAFRTVWRLFTWRREIDTLRRQRNGLEKRVIGTVQALMPAGLEPIVDPGHPRP